MAKNEKLAELQRKHAELTAKRDAERAAVAEAREIKRLEIELENNEAILKAERELGEQGIECAVLFAPDGRAVILKKAPYALYRKFQDTPNTKASDIEQFVQSCRFYPDAEEFGDIQEAFPGLLIPCMTAIAHMAGGAAEAVAKK